MNLKMNMNISEYSSNYLPYEPKSKQLGPHSVAKLSVVGFLSTLDSKQTIDSPKSRMVAPVEGKSMSIAKSDFVDWDTARFRKDEGAVIKANQVKIGPKFAFIGHTTVSRDYTPKTSDVINYAKFHKGEAQTPSSGMDQRSVTARDYGDYGAVIQGKVNLEEKKRAVLTGKVDTVKFPHVKIGEKWGSGM